MKTDYLDLMHSPKDIAVNFLTMAAAGDIDAAYAKYVDMNGKHHNVHFPAGFEALKKGMKESDDETPNKTFTPMNVIVDGDLVAVHSKLIRAIDAPEIAVVHILKIQNGKIVEMWDLGTELPKDMPNADGAF